MNRDEIQVSAKITNIDKNSIRGWAFNKLDFKEPLTVQVYFDKTFIDEQLADRRCHDLESAGLPDINYGFEIALPSTARKKGAQIFVKEKTTQRIIGIITDPDSIQDNDKLTILTAGISKGATEGQYGCIDRIDESGISGWYINLNSPEEIFGIDLFLDKYKIGTAYPASFRPDLAELVDNPTYSGFHLSWNGANLTSEVKDFLKKSDLSINFFGKIKDRNAAVVFPGVAPTAKDLYGWIIKLPPTTMSKKQLDEAVKNHAAAEKINIKKNDGVNAIAFYLPQYHPIPENNEWWGRGFTEWTNVAQGKPNFAGHDQPRVPADLGYYDLRLAEVREQQAELAKQNGIYGFCYYYYWFEGRRILERPLQEMLDSGTPDFPFCICWANETWSRRWDGSENEVLLKQNHTFENDVKFIHDVIPLFKDSRYIRFNGAPVLLIYRTELFPDPLKTAQIWRKICHEEGIGDIHLCAVESFGFNSPLSIGFDSSVQFPPHGITSAEVSSKVEELDKDFGGKIYDYEEVVANEINKDLPLYPRYPGVMCGWDNTARRKKNGHIFVNASPDVYEVWLRSAVDKAKASLAPGNQFVFINAWNEWAEGTYLEPDMKHGHGYLNATKRAMGGSTNWKQLIAYAKTRNKFDELAFADLIKNLESELISQDRSLKYLKHIHKNTLHDTSLRVVLSARAPMQIDTLPQNSAGHGNIDRINTHSVGKETLLALPRDRWIFVTGWVTVPEVQVTASSSAYIVLECMRTRAKYYGLLNSRDERNDITHVFPDRPEHETRFAGFSFYLDARQLPLDQYRIGIVQLAVNGNIVTFFDGVYDLV